MKPRCNSRISIFAVSCAALFAASPALLAVDYVFGSGSGVTPFTITASDTARELGFNWSQGSFSGNDSGAVYFRDVSDRTYAHFDLSTIQGAGISGSVNLNFTVDATYGGDINVGQVSVANGAWSYPGASPGFTAISGATGPNGSFPNGTTATWTIDGSAFAGFLDNPGAFPGLVVSAGAGSTAHFSGLPTLTGTALVGQVTVADGTDWSTAVWNSGTSTLTVSGTSDVSGGNVAIQSGATVSVVDSATMGSGSFAGFISNAGTLSFASSAAQTLSGSISGSGALTKSGAGTLALTGNNNGSGEITIDGGSLQIGNGSNSGTLGTGNVIIEGNLTFNRSDSYGTGSNQIFSGAGTITKEGADELIFNGTSDHTNVAGVSNVAVNDGLIRTDYWGQWSSSLNLSVNNNGKFEMWNTSVSLATLSGNGTVQNTKHWGRLQTLTIAAGSFSGSIADSGVTSGGAGSGDTRIDLVKEGAATLTLSGINAYTGSTTVTGGTLSLGNGTTNTALANTADVTVDSGCTLNLNYTGTDTIDELWLGGVQKSPGVYGSGNSGGLITGTGTLTVTNGPSANDYDAWGSTYGLSAGSEGGDLDNDGLTNQDEYAFGLIPNSGSSINPITVALNKATGQFSYQRRDNGLTNLTYTVWYSTDLSAWAEDTGATQPEGTPDGNGVETINVILTPALLANPKLFIQVRAN